MTASPWSLPDSDLDDAAAACEMAIRTLDGSRVLVTGGTGFLGSWIVATLLRGRDLFALDIDLVLLTRRGLPPEVERLPSVETVVADVREMPHVGQLDYVIHGATASSAPKGSADGNPIELGATAALGTSAVLSAVSRYRPRMLYLSSGAVYGPRHAAVTEDDRSASDDAVLDDEYAAGKLRAETLCQTAYRRTEVSPVIARLFAFVGPRLPTDRHFAAGNFLHDLVSKQSIAVHGDGTAMRSYLYAGDLAEWCWRGLVSGVAGRTYNFGSDEAISIGALAGQVASLHNPPLPVSITGTSDGSPPSWYVPVVNRAKDELGLEVRTPLSTALAKTAEWITHHPE